MQQLHRHISALVTIPDSEAPVISAYFDLRTPLEVRRSSFLIWSTAARCSFPRSKQALFDEAADREELVRLATLYNIAIEVCEGDELLQSHGGVGCLLRFRMEYLPIELLIPE